MNGCVVVRTHREKKPIAAKENAKSSTVSTPNQTPAIAQKIAAICAPLVASRPSVKPSTGINSSVLRFTLSTIAKTTIVSRIARTALQKNAMIPRMTWVVTRTF